jgi:DNA-binding transcriptional ArsR family regulator
MSEKENTAGDVLERIFHEPARLAIMSALGAAGGDGKTFNGLKADCGLTDGNLSRHLKVLEEAGSVRIEKRFVDLKPRTTVYISAAGLVRFRQYLDVLEEMLKTARSAIPETKKAKVGLSARPIRI